MKISIPTSVQKEIRLLLKGVKATKKLKKEKKERPKEELVPLAEKRIRFLNAVANTEPLHTLIIEQDLKIFIIHSIGTVFKTIHPKGPSGQIILRKSQNKAAVYSWFDADYPANRSEADYTLLTLEEVERWHPSNLEIFVTLSEREMWVTIKKQLRWHREMIE